ncbi:MAG TPA: transglutaminase-like cysteine peptidase [Alphaproteobacteria bacterium]|nr:transglutaminase-like cysteine peptidase [Alphaproteobacteria bacterium]
MQYQKEHKGIFSGLKARLKKNRLGELLVLDGILTPQQLDLALQTSRARGQQLGHVLVADNLVSRSAIRRTLFEQFTLRCLMTGVAVFISLASMGFAKQARAGQIQDATARISLVQQSFEKASYHPKLFGSTEKRSTSLKAFTKWTTMFERFNASLNSSSGSAEITKFQRDLQELKGMPLNKMVVRVNDMMNAKRYVTDQANYGQTDYWATPVEFLKRGGDCEDYAIAKYTALKALGVPENRLRIAIVQDLQKNVPHAILIVYTDQGAMVLDNQMKAPVSVDRVTHYKPIFSINQEAWWLHTAPKDGSVTRVASSSR